MIRAKDIFSLERDMIAETQYLLNNSNLSPDELEQVVNTLNDEISEQEYLELNQRLIDRQISPLDRIKNGEIVKVKDINIACAKAVKHE